MIVCSESSGGDLPPAQQWVSPFPSKNGDSYGELAEWSKAADLKSVGGAEPSVGSNPTFPAKFGHVGEWLKPAPC